MAIHAAYQIDEGEETKMGVGRYWTYRNAAEQQAGMTSDSAYTFEISYSPLGSWKPYVSVANQELPKDGQTFTLKYKSTNSGAWMEGQYKVMSLTELRKTKPLTEPFNKTDGTMASKGVAANRTPNNNIGKQNGGSNIVANVNPNIVPSMTDPIGMYALRTGSAGASRIFIYADKVEEMGDANIAEIIRQNREDGNERVAAELEKKFPDAAEKVEEITEKKEKQAEDTKKRKTAATAIGLGTAGVGSAMLMFSAPKKMNGKARRLNGGGAKKGIAIALIVIGLGAAAYGYTTNKANAMSGRLTWR